MLIVNNKQIKVQYDCYLETPDRELSDVYKTPSSIKEEAWKYCCDLMNLHKGRGIKVISFNCMMFTVGFIGFIDGQKHFFYITKEYDRAMPI